MRHGTPSLTSLSKDGEMSCEVRPPRLPTWRTKLSSVLYVDCINESMNLSKCSDLYKYD